MVHDDRGNFVGDMHWHYEYDFDEGEELELERGGAMVQVQELIQRTEQDLTELLDKRVREKEQRQMQTAARLPAATAMLPRSVARPIPPDHFQLRHRPLQQVIGTPSGHHGRAVVPRESPFEQRHTHSGPQDERAAKRRRYDDAPPSKSGYAQALFGQTLTLSATPSSSGPGRNRAIREPDSSPAVEADNCEEAISREQLKPALQEQPKSSHHFNRPLERPRPRGKAPRVDHDKGQSGYDRIAQHPGERSTSRVHFGERRRAPSEDDDVVEIDDPGAALLKPIPPPRAENGAAGAKLHKQNNVRLSTTAARRDVTDGTKRSDEPQNGDDEPECPPARIQQVARTKKPESAVAKPTAKSAASKTSATAKASAPTPSATADIELIRRPSEPVTELRIKSSKKRGLLMMMELPKKPRKDSSETETATVSGSPNADGADDDDPFRSPSPISGTRSQTQHHASRDKSPIHRTTSMELGEDDSLRSPSPAPQDEPVTAIHPPADDHVGTLDITDSVQEENDEFVADLRMDTEVVAMEPQDMITQLRDKPRSPPRGRVFDPYRIPSSSPEEQLGRQSRVASSPKTKAPPHIDNQMKSPSPKRSDAMEPANSKKRTTSMKTTRKARRNIVFEDDEEEDALTEAVEQPTVVLDPEIQQTVTQTKKDTKRKSNNRNALDENSCDHDDEEPVSRARKTKGAAQANRRKSKAPEKDFATESADNQHPKRRRSTRKTPSRFDESKETSLPSGLDDSGEELSPKRSRKERKPKAPESRPRLTKIKKSVKSRELIGFNLSALNVPLGLRGIGVSFSILSSPANESLQRIDTHTSRGLSSELTVGHGDELPESVDTGLLQKTGEAEKRTSCETLDRPQPQEARSPTPTSLLGEPRLAGRSLNRDKTERTEQPSVPAQPGQAVVTKQLSATIGEVLGPELAVKTSDIAGWRVVSSPPKKPSGRSPQQVQVQLLDNDKQYKQSIARSKTDTELPSEGKEQDSPRSGISTANSASEKAAKGCEPEPVASDVAPRFDDVSVQNTKDAYPHEFIPGGPGHKPETEAPEETLDTAEGVQAVPTLGRTQRRKPLGLCRTISATRRINNLTAPILQSDPPEDPVAESSTKPAPVVRIANPASRGRKAALKSHAAGQVPQRQIPPTQPSALVPLSTADFVATQLDEPPKEPERPKKKMAFPGFQSARGEGPWSREAFDLLESGRPV